MTTASPCVICGAILTSGWSPRPGWSDSTAIERPPLAAAAGLDPDGAGRLGRPRRAGRPRHRRASRRPTEYLNRVYESREPPGRPALALGQLFAQGTNLRHSPEICLPSGGWTKVESQMPGRDDRCAAGRAAVPITRLGYWQGELVQRVGFWYYIFGEGRLEHYVRRLPITSRSSHGGRPAGSGLTVEVFCPGRDRPRRRGPRDFARAAARRPSNRSCPSDRAEYHIP